jgi:hypothetical protein
MMPLFVMWIRLFVVNLAGFDRFSLHDRSKNRLIESCELCESQFRVRGASESIILLMFP